MCHGPCVTQSARYNANAESGGRPRVGSEAAILTRSCGSAGHTRGSQALKSSLCPGKHNPRNRRNQPGCFHSGIGREKNSESYPPPPQKNHCLSQAPKRQSWILCEQVGGRWHVSEMGLPRTLTCTVLLIRPVPAVVLPVAFPPVGDAVPILARELEVAGAVGGLRGVFWGVNRMVSHLPCTL